MGKSPHDVVVLPFRSTCLSADRDYIDGGKALTCGKGSGGVITPLLSEAPARHRLRLKRVSEFRNSEAGG